MQYKWHVHRLAHLGQSIVIQCQRLAPMEVSDSDAAKSKLIGTLGQIAFRLTYYGDWLPNTAHAKVAFTVARVESGAQCVAGAALSSYALWAPAMLALYVAWRDAQRRPRILLNVTLIIAWTTYTATIGGA